MKVLRIITIVLARIVTLPITLLLILGVSIYALYGHIRYELEWSEAWEAFVEGYKYGLELDRHFINDGWKATVEWDQTQ